ncbi:SRPBCC domain-containing protein [Fulvivirga sp. 29W222]|uniref:SRPBCC domain-containing protein n=1 Tax=Fulvivirga marina TaxID=2494733 RepID=A0A937KC46_9BACT|nr:SRPBCC domain-containing protein [Fulvivirga marina]MBL6447781.1 SRPBCC domain-containing protein [Fulvivirga marina]
MESVKDIGLTKDVGYQFGKRRTFDLSVEDVWEFMFSKEGLRLWLGTLFGDLELKQPFETQEGIRGELRVMKPFSHIRMSWAKEEWENTSTLQVRVLKAKYGATIVFHQEKLQDKTQRKEMKNYWDEVMENITEALS